ncbi:hypothetical protein Tco_1302863 [Tanacetum coccineum]
MIRVHRTLVHCNNAYQSLSDQTLYHQFLNHGSSCSFPQCFFSVERHTNHPFPSASEQLQTLVRRITEYNEFLHSLSAKARRYRARHNFCFKVWNASSSSVPHSYFLFLAQVTEKESSKKQLQDVSVIRNFPEVFPDDLPGLSDHLKQVEFRIGAVPERHLSHGAPYTSGTSSSVYSKIDLRSGYHQLRFREEDIPIMAIQTRKKVGLLHVQQLAVRHYVNHSSSDSSSDFHSDASSNSSSRYSLSDHSSPDLPSTSAGPSHKRQLDDEVNMLAGMDINPVEAVIEACFDFADIIINK